MTPHRAPQSYSERNEQEYRTSIYRALNRRHSKDERLILLSPNGSPFALSVTDAGALVVTPL